MRKISFKLSILALVLVAALAMVPAASANSVTTLTQGAYTAQVSVGTNSVTVTISGPTSGFFVNNIAVQLGGNNVTISSGSASSGSWTFLNGKNAVQCGGSTGNWLCATPTGATGNQAGNGFSITYNFTGAPAGSTVSVQFIICSTSANPCTKGRGGNFITNFSQSGTLTSGGPPPSVPEPGTLGLLGTGLVGIAGVMRRRFMA